MCNSAQLACRVGNTLIAHMETVPTCQSANRAHGDRAVLLRQVPGCAALLPMSRSFVWLRSLFVSSQERMRGCCCNECLDAPRLLRPTKTAGSYGRVSAYFDKEQLDKLRVVCHCLLSLIQPTVGCIKNRNWPCCSGDARPILPNSGYGAFSYC